MEVASIRLAHPPAHWRRAFFLLKTDEHRRRTTHAAWTVQPSQKDFDKMLCPLYNNKKTQQENEGGEENPIQKVLCCAVLSVRTRRRYSVQVNVSRWVGGCVHVLWIDDRVINLYRLRLLLLLFFSWFIFTALRGSFERSPLIARDCSNSSSSTRRPTCRIDTISNYRIRSSSSISTVPLLLLLLLLLLPSIRSLMKPVPAMANRQHDSIDRPPTNAQLSSDPFISFLILFDDDHFLKGVL